MRPIVGIPACTRDLLGMVHYATPAIYADALMDAAGALPVLLPPVGEAMLAMLDRLDGLLLSGSLSNVAPALYGCDRDATPDLHDPARDATMMPVIRRALAMGMPVLAICRGVQELNVALGGSLHQELQEVPGRMDHRSGGGAVDHMFRPKHPVRLEGGLARILGCASLQVNSLHTQALDRVAPGLAVEAVAEDGTVEAVRVEGAVWAYGLQWHPEWGFAGKPESLALFAAFGQACAAYAARPAALPAATAAIAA